MSKKRYVLGFLFNMSKSCVLLIKKENPPWMRGMWNGVGGKIEKGENAEEAMERETREEVDLHLIPWERVGVLNGINNDNNEFKCFLFRAFSDHINFMDPIGYEDAGIFLLHELKNMPILPNLNFLIPYMLVDDGNSFIRVSYSGSK
jgi:8-oxo-dGTP diphosphatase